MAPCKKAPPPAPQPRPLGCCLGHSCGPPAAEAAASLGVAGPVLLDVFFVIKGMCHVRGAQGLVPNARHQLRGRSVKPVAAASTRTGASRTGATRRRRHRRRLTWVCGPSRLSVTFTWCNCVVSPSLFCCFCKKPTSNALKKTFFRYKLSKYMQ